MGVASQARVVHEVAAGRWRVRVAALYRQRALGAEIERRLGRAVGVRKVRANPLTATVLVLGDPGLSIDDLLGRLDELAASDVVAPPAQRGPRASWRPSTDVLDSLALLSTALRRRVRGEPAPEAAQRSVEAVSEPWHTFDAGALLERWQVDERGLSESRAQEHRARYGANVLAPARRRSEIAIFLGQLTSVPVALLAGSAVLSIASAGFLDAAAILVVIGLNAGIGYATESRAERIIASLEEGGRRVARVRRDGASSEIDAAEVVPGDLLLLSPGTWVAADARLVEAVDLTVDESVLTGESLPVSKHTQTLGEPRRPLAERTNLVFRGTVVTGGTGVGVVVATGAATELGLVQALVGTVERRATPLERQLRRLGVELALGAAAVCGAVFVVGISRGYGTLQMLRTATSLAVAAVPEGLPTVAITTLALGVRRMRELRVLVRRLDAVETLGAVQVFCLDKTGTITENRMSVVSVFAGMQAGDVDEAWSADADVEQMLEVAALCNESEIVDDEVRGTPTEAALVRLALRAGVDVHALREANPLLETHYRTQERSIMTTVHSRPDGSRWLAVKGRPTEVIERATRYSIDGREHPLDATARKRIEQVNEHMAGLGLRVLAVGRALADDPDAFVFLGLVGIADPPRAEVRDVLGRFHAAGIDTVMITGDQSATALAVARRVGLGRDGRLDLIDSTRLEELPAAVLGAIVGNVQVFARVNPAHKLEIVRALQSAGRVVAMTGDGVNDSPALKAADVGVAMGARGTSAAREVAAVVLEDDRLSSMLVAVEQGRTTYADIQKAVHFMLATNSSEILLTFAQVAAGLGGTLTPMQLLWINIITDVFPELALAVEPPEVDAMAHPPRDPAAPMFRKRDLARIVSEGSVLTLGALGAYAWGRRRYGVGPHANTLAFAALTSAQLLHAVSTRSDRHSIFDPGRLPKNAYIPLTLASSLGLQFLVLLVPGARRLLGATRVAAVDWGVAAATATATLFVNELLKMALRPNGRPRRLPAHTDS